MTRATMLMHAAFLLSVALAKPLYAEQASTSVSVEAPIISAIDNLMTDAESDELEDDDELEIVASEEEDALVEPEHIPEPSNQQHEVEKTIRKIHIVRRKPNRYITAASIYNHLPFHEGAQFNRFATNRVIKKLYELDLFDQIEVRATKLDDDSVDLYIIVDEQPELAELTINGNDAFTEKDLEEKLQTARLQSISARKVERLKKKLRDAYRKKNYHLAEITSEYRIEDGKAYLTLNVDEGPTSTVRRVFFTGNNSISDKRLKQIMMTQEDWVLSFLNRDGSYDPEFIEKDKRNIEFFYTTEGFFEAKVTDVDIKMDPDTKQYQVTYHIREGAPYTFGEVRVESNEILSESYLLSQIPAQAGAPYSSRKVWDSMEALKNVWGQLGYVFIDVQPLMVPNRDKNTVDITFQVELGDRVFARRINILGNTKTRNNVIRRKLTVQEGDLITHQKLEGSKERVQGLSFFENKEDGVTWKVKRVNEKEADLDLIVKETRTGRMNFQMGFGGSPDNPSSAATGFSVAGSISDTNLFGKGLQANLTAQWSVQEWTASGTYIDPYFMDKPILMESNAHYTHTNRGDELNNVSPFTERSTGGSIGSGYLIQKRFTDVYTRASVGIESIGFSKQPVVKNTQTIGAATYQSILNMRFQSGTIGYLQMMLAQDVRNHTFHPSKGYQWWITTRIGFPIGPRQAISTTVNEVNIEAVTTAEVTQLGEGFADNAPQVATASPASTTAETFAYRQGLGFAKLELDASWYTPLIGDRFLVFGLHGHFGWITNLKDYVVPFRELYHIGGATTVRGWQWGQIGPTFLNDSIGASKAFYVNAELIFPIRPDFSVKGCVFYDAGTGWDTPRLDLSPSMRQYLKNDSFDYRHSIGFGVRMLQPQPIRIDFGVKLDKRKGEPLTEIHFSTYREF